MKLALFLVALPLGASTISVQQISFAPVLTGDATASPIWFGAGGPGNASAIVADTISVDAYTEYPGAPSPNWFASAILNVVEQITITGGSGTGIAVACANTSFQVMRDQFYGIPDWNVSLGLTGPQESGDFSGDCPNSFLPGARIAPQAVAADFTYGVPFDMNVTMTADAYAAGYGDEESATVWSQFFILDPPLDVPEPATLGMLGIGLVLLGLRRHPRRSVP